MTGLMAYPPIASGIDWADWVWPLDASDEGLVLDPLKPHIVTVILVTSLASCQGATPKI